MKRETQKELLGIVKNNYEEIAEHFSETRSKHIWPELIKISRIIQDDVNVLDLACGNGRLLESFLGKKISYLGIDASNELIKLARKKYPNNKFLTGDMLNLKNIKLKEKGLPNQFDYIFIIAALQHIPSENLRISFLKELKNYLKKDSKLIISNWNLWEQKKYRKIILKTYLLKIFGKNKLDFGDIIFPKNYNKNSKRYYHAFRKSELKRILKKAGYKIESLYIKENNIYSIVSKP